MKNQVLKNEYTEVKHRGKVYTPDYLVADILNQAGYSGTSILKKHIMDNSCGNGQFIVQIIERYCIEHLNKYKNNKNLKVDLETYIHGIEIDSAELKKCIDRCDDLAENFGVKDVHWDFICNDTLNVTKYDGKLDFVVGNPPYVRVHNLNENFDKVKKYKFAMSGMTDLFIVFYEIGINMLNDNGVLCYISPSSFFTSLAGTKLREYLYNSKKLKSVCDLKHFQAFNAIAYTTIIYISNATKNEYVEYFSFDENTLSQKKVDDLKYDDFCINGNFYFASKKNLEMLKNIIENKKVCSVQIKNGFATLNDSVFINNFDFKSKHIIPVIKGSRGKWASIIYPYDKNGKLYDENELKKDKPLYEYLLENKNKLLHRDFERNSNCWYAFGRSQAINDTYREKISINALIKTSDDLKIIDVPSGAGVYSGLYILSCSENSKEIKEALTDESFGIYISLLGKYKNGGYYTFSSKDVKTYLNYKLGR